MNKKDREIFSLACAFLKLRGFNYWKEMYDILFRVEKREKRRAELSSKMITEKRKNNPMYARSREEKARKGID